MLAREGMMDLVPQGGVLLEVGPLMDMRELKALELAARAKIVWAGDAWSVPSQSTGTVYRVVTWPGAESCQCEDWQLRQQPCKHIIAAKLVEERDGKRTAPPIDTDTP